MSESNPEGHSSNGRRAAPRLPILVLWTLNQPNVFWKLSSQRLENTCRNAESMMWQWTRGKKNKEQTDPEKKKIGSKGCCTLFCLQVLRSTDKVFHSTPQIYSQHSCKRKSRRTLEMISFSGKWFARKIGKTTDGSSIHHGTHIVKPRQRLSLYVCTSPPKTWMVPFLIKTSPTALQGLALKCGQHQPG